MRIEPRRKSQAPTSCRQAPPGGARGHRCRPILSNGPNHTPEPRQAPAEPLCQALGGQGPKIHPVRWGKGQEDIWLGERKILGFTPILRGQKAALGKWDLEGSFWDQTLAQLQKDVGKWAAVEE